MTIDQRTAHVNGITLGYLRHEHRSVSAPTLVLVHGWPHSLHGWIADSGHWPGEEQPDGLVALLSAFVDLVEVPS